MTILRTTIAALSFCFSLALAGDLLAQAALVEGEVKKVDVSAGKITIKHGPIANLDMDSMTMVLGSRIR